MEIVNIYEAGYTDKYFWRVGVGVYFLDRDEALNHIYKGECCDSPILHNTVKCPNGGYLILKSTIPISIVGREQHEQDIFAKALAKLTPEEIEVLGIKN